jgi:two-component system, LuxR family, sensor kinase FixL
MSRGSHIARRGRIGPALPSRIDKEGAGVLLSLLNAVRDAVVIVDPSGHVLVWNAGAEQLLGYRAREMAGERFVRRIVADAEADLSRFMRRAAADLNGEPYTSRWRAKDGQLVDVAGHVTAVRSGRRLIGLALVVHDVASLHESGERQRLEQEVVSIAEEERRRIGRDLHDSVCQQLVAISLEAEVAASGAKDRTAPETDALLQLARSLRQSAEELRQLARGLAPADLAPEELRVNIERLTARMCGLFGVASAFRWAAKAGLRNGAAATHVYRIAQEAISNAIRHGHARNVKVSVTSSKHSLRLIIRDDGVGLPPKAGTAAGAGAAPTDPSGIGIATMHYRAKMAAGQLHITRAKPHGTVVACTIPLAGPRAETPRPKPGPSGRARDQAVSKRLEIVGPRLRHLIEETRALRDRSMELRAQMRGMLERTREMNASSFESRAMARHVFATSRDAAHKRDATGPTNSAD